MMPERRRALMIAPAAPSDGGNGLAMRLGMFLEALSAVFAVDLIVAPITGRADPSDLAWANVHCSRAFVVDIADQVDTHFDLVMRLIDPDARLSAFERYGRPSFTAALTPTTTTRSRALIGDAVYDLIHVGRSYCAPLALSLIGRGGNVARPLLSLDLDESDPRAFHAIGALHDGRGDPLGGRWMRAEAVAFESLVREVARAFDLLWCASDVDIMDIGRFAADLAITLAPNAVAKVARPRRGDDGRTLLFVGSMGYEPNRDALAWFSERIWPRVRDRGLRLRIVGASPPDAVAAMGLLPDVEVVGRVDDIAKAYEDATLSVAPLQAGAGTRLKLIESAMHRTPIVATTFAAEGLGLEHGRHLWLADDPRDFADALTQALSDPLERDRRARAARAHVMTHHCRARCVERLSLTMRAAVQRAAGPNLVANRTSRK